MQQSSSGNGQPLEHLPLATLLDDGAKSRVKATIHDFCAVYFPDVERLTPEILCTQNYKESLKLITDFLLVHFDSVATELIRLDLTRQAFYRVLHLQVPQMLINNVCPLFCEETGTPRVMAEGIRNYAKGRPMWLIRTASADLDADIAAMEFARALSHSFLRHLVRNLQKRTL